MKKIFYIVVIFLFSFNFIMGLQISAPKGPPSVPLIKMIQDNPNYKLNLYTDILTEVIPKFIKEEDNIFIMPTNVAAKFYNKGLNVKILNITSSGILYILSSNSKINNLNDIKNKEIYVPAPGSSPDILTRYIFNKKNIDIKIKYGSSPEITKLFISGRIDLCVLPEPFATKAINKNKKGKRILNFKTEWKNITGSSNIPQVGLVTKKIYAQNNRKEIIKMLKDYKNAVKWVNKNPQKAAILAEKKLGINSEIIKKSIPKMNLISVEKNSAYKVLKNYFSILNTVNKKLIGGKIPDEKIIFK